MKKTYLLTIIVALATISFTPVNNVSAKAIVLEKNPIIIGTQDYDYHYDYGYIEGKGYRDRGDASGYWNMRSHYYYMQGLYGDTYVNYTARINGLADGYYNNEAP